MSNVKVEEKKLGWEVAKELDQRTIMERLVPNWQHVKAAVVGVVVFFILFLVGTWLAGNPFEATVRMPSKYVVDHGLLGNQWSIVWSVVLLAAFFEFMDASAGMGFGTALTPLLLMIGFDPKQIVPVVMIQQGAAGLVGAFLHREFQNVEWKLKPMSETIKLAIIIVISGVIFNVLAIVGVYKIFEVDKIWIKAYVAVLLLMMGVTSLFQSKKERPYKPGKMVFWASLAGFNKGVGGGGYGPVVTIGGLMAGVPVKSMMAVTAISEGSVSTCSVVTWLLMLGSGVTIDYILLPSFMLATMFSAVAAPYMTRVFPEKIWKVVVPAYCLCLTAYAFWKLVPDVVKRLAG
ncbi:MAG: sulfite exporter TauE/SafE family protein [Desulfobacterales bacterium]|nr:sulfite exporter TauE/SafE family protein [Desulfobacterales bacterium]